MFKKIIRFFRKNFIQQLEVKLLHLGFLALLFSILIHPRITIQNNFLISTLFDQTINLNFPYPIEIILLNYIFYSILNFNIITIVRQFRWDVLLLVLFFVISNAIGYYYLFYLNQNWPFFQTNILFLADTFFILFARVVTGDKENFIIKTAFRKYVNKELLEDLIANPSQLELVGEEKEITVLFSDIRGFTTLSEKLQPRSLVQLLNQFLEIMSNVIHKNNGNIDKFIGDAIMAFWNAPINNKQHASLAIYAAIEMIQELEKTKKTQHNFQQLSIGIGINTGKMIVGNVGSKDRLNYTILGDNVNLGSRLEGLTKKYGIHIIVSQNTKNSYQQIGNLKIIFRLLDVITVKGKSIPLKIYQPLLDNNFNRNLIKGYESAFNFYIQGDFKQSYQLFSSLSKLGDGPSQQMCHRLKTFRPSVIWNGVWNWDEK